jgi:hypothetical protein
MRPIVVLFLPRVTEEQRARIANMIPISLKDEYHLLIISGADHVDVKVFHEKDMVELNHEKLSELLTLCNVK